jgi:hypothetical protein
MNQKEVNKAFNQACRQFEYEMTGRNKISFPILLPLTKLALSVVNSILALEKLKKHYEQNY